MPTPLSPLWPNTELSSFYFFVCFYILIFFLLFVIFFYELEDVFVDTMMVEELGLMPVDKSDSPIKNGILSSSLLLFLRWTFHVFF